MKKWILLSILFSSMTLSAQKMDTSDIPFSFFSEGDSMSIVIHQEKIKIPMHKVDSLYRVAIHKVRADMKKKEFKESVKKNMATIENKMNRIIDILIDSPAQKKTLKKDISNSFHDSAPKLDSLFMMLDKFLGTMDQGKKK